MMDDRPAFAVAGFQRYTADGPVMMNRPIAGRS